MTLKRAILALLTIFAIARIGLSLNDSFSQPQIQSRLELYQTNLVLHVAEFKASPGDEFDLNTAVSSIVGDDPYSAASKQYQKVLEESQTSRDTFVTQLKQLDSPTISVDGKEIPEVNAVQKRQLQQQIAEMEKFINELDLKRGILAALQLQKTEAIDIWESAIDRIDNPQDAYAKTALLLKQLWQNESLDEDARSIITNNLDSWFRYQALAQFDRVNNLTRDPARLQA